ncbi:hypothetical protein ACFLX2_00940 [Candidatus Dependentiae bacterium]
MVVKDLQIKTLLFLIVVLSATAVLHGSEGSRYKQPLRGASLHDLKFSEQFDELTDERKAELVQEIARREEGLTVLSSGIEQGAIIGRLREFAQQIRTVDLSVLPARSPIVFAMSRKRDDISTLLLREGRVDQFPVSRLTFFLECAVENLLPDSARLLLSTNPHAQLLRVLLRQRDEHAAFAQQRLEGLLTTNDECAREIARVTTKTALCHRYGNREIFDALKDLPAMQSAMRTLYRRANRRSGARRPAYANEIRELLTDE